MHVHVERVCVRACVRVCACVCVVASSTRLEGNVKKFEKQQEQVKGNIAALQKAK